MSVAESQKLSELLRAVHDLTGIKVAIYDLDCNEIMSYPPEAVGFCQMVRAQEEGLAACSESERACCEACRLERTQQIMRCHAGLTEVTVPVLDGEDLIGYIMLGHFIEEKDRAEFLRQAAAGCAEYGSGKEQVLAYAEQVPCCNESAINCVSKIVDMVASYIVYAGLLHPTETPLRQTILDYIAKNLSADLSIQALCRRFSVSKSELYRLLRQQAPNGVAAYVRQKRFAKACELLRVTRKSTWQIAEEVGYDNPDYFLRAFKKEMGVSAGKYRKSVQ